MSVSIKMSVSEPLMQIPLQFRMISLWLMVTAIILLITSELISSDYGTTRILVNKKRLKNVSITLGILSLLTLVINIYYLTLF